jgi:hypothetical protein
MNSENEATAGETVGTIEWLKQKNSQIKIGDKVKIRWGRKFGQTATVVSFRQEIYHISLDRNALVKYEDETFEWVSNQKIQVVPRW